MKIFNNTLILLINICLNSTVYTQAQVQTEKQTINTNLSIQAVLKIHLEKTTNGIDADTPPGPEIIEGADVVWRYTVSNLGNVNLSNITISDDVEGVIGTIGSLPVGTTKFLDLSKIANVGQYTNIGTATCVYGGTTVQASDSSHYIGITNESFNRSSNKSIGMRYSFKNLYPKNGVGHIDMSQKFVITNTTFTIQEDVLPRIMAGRIFRFNYTDFSHVAYKEHFNENCTPF